MKNTLIAIAVAASAIAGHAQEDGSSDELITAIEQVTGWTRQELVEGLAMLERACSNECQNATGRVKWHGRVVSCTIDTNALTKVSTHEDGFVYTEPFRAVGNRTITQKLSAEERAAKKEAARLARIEAEKRQKTARLNYILSHESDEIGRLSQKYPPLLAGLLYTNEVNTLRTELGETVDAVVTPQD